MAVMRLRFAIKGILLCLALLAIPYSASGASTVQVRAEIRAKEAELARLNRELAEMKKVLEQFERLSEKSHYYQRNVCGQYYRAALNERAIVQQRKSIPGYDKQRADAKTRYNRYRRQMIDCIDRSVAGDRTLHRRGATDYNSLLSLYNRSKATATQVGRQFKVKRQEAKRLQQEIKTLKFGLPEIEEEPGTIVRTECPANSDPVWHGNRQSCKCHDAAATYLWDVGVCAKLDTAGPPEPYTGPWPAGGPRTPPALLGQCPPGPDGRIPACCDTAGNPRPC